MADRIEAEADRIAVGSVKVQARARAERGIEALVLVAGERGAGADVEFATQESPAVAELFLLVAARGVIFAGHGDRRAAKRGRQVGLSSLVGPLRSRAHFD